MTMRSISRRVYRAILAVSAASMAVMVLTVLLVNEDLERTMLKAEFAQEREFLLMNGDILTDLDYGDLLDSHRASRAPLTVATYRREHRVDFGVLELEQGAITCFTEKPVPLPRLKMPLRSSRMPSARTWASARSTTR